MSLLAVPAVEAELFSALLLEAESGLVLVLDPAGAALLVVAPVVPELSLGLELLEADGGGVLPEGEVPPVLHWLETIFTSVTWKVAVMLLLPVDDEVPVCAELDEAAPLCV